MERLNNVKCFSAKRLQKLLRRGLPLGKGAFTAAYLTSAGDRAACVKIFLTKIGLRNMTNEAEVLTVLSGVPHVPELIGVGESPVALVTDFGGVTLRDEMRRTSISEAQAINIGLQVAETLRRMHECGWAHCDLKLDNIVVKPRSNLFDVTVIDFGNATRLGRPCYNKVKWGHIKFLHLAPELLEGGRVTSKI
ncbi:myosin light chain kinase A-like [Oratosquilla oratoria]|uniref:myosin light chain kinase A-like n=1 Tax=Oratosquilla oratoria TaxID=337810 RepID=UPI003F75AB94